ncbi:thioester reductase domain-containing protein [Nonomuraea sp. NN258]|uniref:thioester reductase domain-containing protein n=1 Tax=Nonomuraea antri TaxID=2730852 RepID=UPI001567EAD5|nr:thioester reductase domain-containing protein [Nonomuraea antri]NRQ31990.1 thioester reductase domain-containing protein [Nonomuraea antri]
MVDALSPAQLGIWTGQALDPGNPAYNAGEYVEIRGPFDAGRFERALRAAIGSAEALHARFPGAGTQVVDVDDDWPLHRPQVATRAEAEAWMRADLDTVVNLAEGPLFGQALFRLGPELHLWYQRIHHIAADGYAFALLAKRVADLYSERPAAGFGAFGPVLAEAAAYAGADGQRERDRAFWLERCADLPVPPLLAPPAPVGRRVLRRTVELPGRVAPDVLAAVTAAYLHRRTGAGEAVLGLPVMNRLGSAAIKVPCMAMNIVPLRVPVPAGASLTGLAAHVTAELAAGRPHHRYRYEWLRRDLRLVGGERRLFGPVVNVLPFGTALRFGAAAGGAVGTVHSVSAGPVEDLSIAVSERGGSFRAEFDANAAAYAPAELDAHAEGWLDLLTELTADPDRPLSVRPPSLGSPFLGSPGVRVLDGGPLPVPAVPVRTLIEGQAAARPHAVAVELEGRRLTYRELLESARSFAGRVSGAAMVAVMLPRGFEAITAIVGSVLAGAAYLPVDPAWPAARIEAVLADARPDALVTADGIERRGGTRREPGLAYVMYTSGSTGRPKGVAVGHEALAHFVAGATVTYGLRAEDRVLQFAPLHFDASVEEIFLTLCAGATLVLRTEEMIQSVPRLLQACGDLGVSVLDLPTAFWHEVAYALSTGTATLPRTLRTVIIGGEAALPERVARWHAAAGSVRLFNTYGPTEATVVATVAELVPGDQDAPIGRPLPGVRCLVDDGELVLMGGGLARGYLDAPFAEIGGERAYRTGDRVRVRADGRLVYLGRIDDEFKISGHRVDPAEIEVALLRHPSVRAAAVVGEVRESGVRHLTAHVVPAGEVSAAELRGHLAGLLPAAVIPAGYVFAAELPRTTSGKIDRAALRATRAPATPVADGLVGVVLGIWSDVLGVTDISPESDFFQLGGHSLQTIQVVTRLAAELGREVPAALLFQHPTAAALAGALTSHAPAMTSAGTSAVTPAVAGAEHVRDAVLPPDVLPRAVPSGRPPTYLLTGATGFVGAHLLAELLSATEARIVCPVRAADEPSGLRRLAESLADQGLPGIPRDRVRAVPADLAASDRLGDGLLGDGLLGDGLEVETVFHNAAVVSVTRAYRSLRAVNVTATLDLLRLGVPVHYVSTLAVAPAGPDVPEEFFPAHDGLDDGYRQSKWAAEELVRQAGERGIRTAVHRLGRVVGAPEHGYVNPNDLFWRILRAGVPAGVLPDLDVAEPWTPVDYAAATIVALAGQGATGVHNLAPLPPTGLRQAMGWAREYGYRLSAVPVAEWVERVRDGDADSAATAAFFDLAAGPPAELGTVRGERAAAAGTRCPSIGRDTMHRYLDHCVKTGLLPRPTLAKGTEC